MSIRFAAAQAVSSISTWGLKHVFRRPAANFPGKIALYVDPRLLANLRGKLTRGSIMVVGTNGKTTVTNLLADVLEGSGARVVCNRTIPAYRRRFFMRKRPIGASSSLTSCG